jgi:hypothetical protein
MNVASELADALITNRFRFRIGTEGVICLVSQRNQITAGSPLGSTKPVALLRWNFSSLAKLCLVVWDGNWCRDFIQNSLLLTYRGMKGSAASCYGRHRAKIKEHCDVRIVQSVETAWNLRILLCIDTGEGSNFRSAGHTWSRDVPRMKPMLGEEKFNVF